MKIHRNVINEHSRSKLPSPRGYNKSHHIWLYDEKSGEEKEIAEISWQLILGRSVWKQLGMQLSVGNSGSETPWDGLLLIPFLSFYWSFSRGRRLANWMTSRKKPWQTRQIGFRFIDRRFYLKLWAPKWDSSRNDPWWWEISFRTSLLDIIWGPKRYWYKDVADAVINIDMPEASYTANVTLQTSEVGRVKRKKRTHLTFMADVDIKGGIPYRNHEWKGDNVYGFGVAMGDNEVPFDWQPLAKVNIEAWVIKERLRHNYSPPVHPELTRDITPKPPQTREEDRFLDKPNKDEAFPEFYPLPEPVYTWTGEPLFSESSGTGGDDAGQSDGQNDGKPDERPLGNAKEG